MSSRQARLRRLDEAPPVRMSVTDTTADQQDMQWGYVLHKESGMGLSGDCGIRPTGAYAVTPGRAPIGP
ncbi:hypothetical protein ACGFSB_21480 [Streptomyces sp. NPDC048441]|uniref:hypothetical protein n=1 Tax=Streptomyces sp. NPDC048441 TaxID=3365552 RepID=UPI003723C925